MIKRNQHKTYKHRMTIARAILRGITSSAEIAKAERIPLGSVYVTLMQMKAEGLVGKDGFMEWRLIESLERIQESIKYKNNVSGNYSKIILNEAC